MGKEVWTLINSDRRLFIKMLYEEKINWTVGINSGQRRQVIYGPVSQGAAVKEC